MRWQIEETVGEFGRLIGIDDLALNDRGSVALQIERIGVFGIEIVGGREEQVAVSLTRNYREPFGEEACRLVLENCHYRSSRAFPVHPAFSGTGRLSFAIRLESSEFTPQSVHEILDDLDRLHESMNQVAIPDS